MGRSERVPVSRYRPARAEVAQRRLMGEGTFRLRVASKRGTRMTEKPVTNADFEGVVNSSPLT
jgi:hypothetical protein